MSIDPAVYLAVVKKWIAEHPRIHVHRQASISEVCADADGVTRLVYASEDRIQTLRPSILIDISGRAASVQMFKEGLVKEGQALAGLIIQMRGVATKALQFPNGVATLQAIRKAVEAGIL